MLKNGCVFFFLFFFLFYSFECVTELVGSPLDTMRKPPCKFAFKSYFFQQKPCFFQFPNMTNLRNAPYFLMSGPAKYILSLEKADPSARIYTFQYNWDKNETTNVIGFSFDTPNSNVSKVIRCYCSLSSLMIVSSFFYVNYLPRSCRITLLLESNS